MLFSGLMFAGIGSIFVLIGLLLTLPIDLGECIFWIAFSTIFVTTGVKLIYNDLNKKNNIRLQLGMVIKFLTVRLLSSENDPLVDKYN